MSGGNAVPKQAPMTDKLSSEEQNCLLEEEGILVSVVDSLKTQVEKRIGRVQTESARVHVGGDYRLYSTVVPTTF